MNQQKKKFNREGRRNSCTCAETNAAFFFHSYCFLFQFVTCCIYWKWRWQVSSAECTMLPGVELIWKERWYWHREQTPQKPNCRPLECYNVHYIRLFSQHISHFGEQKELWGKYSGYEMGITRWSAFLLMCCRGGVHNQKPLICC